MCFYDLGLDAWYDYFDKHLPANME
eukprot:COSAG02_NODE_59906_length_275_cov_0.551724_1_plen_24_part_10